MDVEIELSAACGFTSKKKEEIDAHVKTCPKCQMEVA